jgi:hypothetical protein
MGGYRQGPALTDEERRDAVRETLDSLPSDVLEWLGDVAVEERHPDRLMGIYDPTGGLQWIVSGNEDSLTREHVVVRGPGRAIRPWVEQLELAQLP